MATIKKKTLHNLHIRFCPKCKSLDTTANINLFQTFGIIPEHYTCNTCGNTGLVFPEVEVSELKKSKVRPFGGKQGLGRKSGKMIV